MATLEIDPLLRKGFRFLHSRSRDSADQLKALLDEARRQRQGKTLSTVKDPFNLRKESPIPRSKQSSPSNITLSKGNNELKREISHKGREDDVVTHGPPKRPKLDSPHNVFKSHTPSPTPSIKSESSSRSRKSDDSDSDADMNGLAMEIGINCTVCKSFEQTSGNQLVECQECHSLFHQECHKPSVSHQDITDPRLVWYCAKCSRSFKKQVNTRGRFKSSIVTSSTSGSSVGIRASSSASSSSSKGMERNVSTASSRPSPSKAIGMQRPSPFANLSSVSRSSLASSNNSSSSSSSSSTVSSSNTRSSSMASSNTRSSSSGPPAANSLLHAERRVHLMKKKAAAKNAERRKL